MHAEAATWVSSFSSLVLCELLVILKRIFSIMDHLQPYLGPIIQTAIFGLADFLREPLFF